jgi:hypothetical protein
MSSKLPCQATLFPQPLVIPWGMLKLYFNIFLYVLDQCSGYDIIAQHEPGHQTMQQSTRLNSDTRRFGQTFASARFPGAEPLSALSIVASEVNLAAIQATAIASCLNGLQAGRTKFDLRLTLDFVPKEPEILAALRQHGVFDRDQEISKAALAPVEKMFSIIYQASLLLHDMFNESEQLGEYRSIALHSLRLSAAWQAACRSSEIAVHRLSEELLASGRTIDVSSSLIIAGLADSAARGLCPSLNACGLPIFAYRPGRPGRYSIGQPCQIDTAARTVKAFAKDIYASGLGVEQADGLKGHDAVCVTLANGRRFTGTVTWQSRSAAGIRFDRHLLPSDPLLGG